MTWREGHDCPTGGAEPSLVSDVRVPLVRLIGQAVRVCAYPPNLRRTTMIAGSVGAGLVAINQLGPLLQGHRPLLVWVRVALDFLVPFLVSNLGVLTASRGAFDHCPPASAAGGTDGNNPQSGPEQSLLQSCSSSWTAWWERGGARRAGR
jgi:hypothetical protein